MQGIRGADAEISSMYAAARRMARKYGCIGIVEPDDVANNAMLKLLKRTGDREPTLGWLYKTVRSAAADAGRNCARERTFVCTIDDESLRSVCERADEHGNVYLNGRCGAAHDDDREPDLLSQLMNMLRQLTLPLRQVLVLYAAGHTYDQIAALMNTTVGTVRSRLHYARRRAKSLLGDLG